jgi:hypothetical protein
MSSDPYAAGRQRISRQASGQNIEMQTLVAYWSGARLGARMRFPIAVTRVGTQSMMRRANGVPKLHPRFP